MASLCLVQCSPRLQGTSDTAAEIAMQAQSSLLATDLRLDRLVLRDQVIHPCIACGTCDRRVDVCPLDTRTGHTPHGKAGTDSAKSLLHHMREADSLLLTLPIYFYGIPAHTKALIDRAQRFWAEQRDDTRPPKPAFAILCAARPEGERLFEASQLVLRCFLRTLGFSLQASCLLRGLERPKDIDTQPAYRERLTDFGNHITSLIRPDVQ